MRVLYNRKTQKLTLNPRAEFKSSQLEEVLKPRFVDAVASRQRAKSESDRDDDSEFVYDPKQSRYVRKATETSEISGYRRKVVYEVRSDNDIDNDQLLLDVLTANVDNKEEPYNTVT